jgi:hypothetical protein
MTVHDMPVRLASQIGERLAREANLQLCGKEVIRLSQKRSLKIFSLFISSYTLCASTVNGHHQVTYKKQPNMYICTKQDLLKYGHI